MTKTLISHTLLLELIILAPKFHMKMSTRTKSTVPFLNNPNFPERHVARGQSLCKGATNSSSRPEMSSKP